MLTPADAVLDVVAIVKVGKTLGGSQLMNIANLPAVHYPFVFRTLWLKAYRLKATRIFSLKGD